MKNLKNILATKDQNVMPSALKQRNCDEISLNKTIPKTCKNKKKHVAIKTMNQSQQRQNKQNIPFEVKQSSNYQFQKGTQFQRIKRSNPFKNPSIFLQIQTSKQQRLTQSTKPQNKIQKSDNQSDQALKQSRNQRLTQLMNQGLTQSRNSKSRFTMQQSKIMILVSESNLSQIANYKEIQEICDNTLLLQPHNPIIQIKQHKHLSSYQHFSSYQPKQETVKKAKYNVKRRVSQHLTTNSSNFINNKNVLQDQQQKSQQQIYMIIQTPPLLSSIKSSINSIQYNFDKKNCQIKQIKKSSLPYNNKQNRFNKKYISQKILIQFEDQCMERIDLYRFLNRIIYKSLKYFNFQQVKTNLNVIINKLIELKILILLQTKNEIQSFALIDKNMYLENKNMYSEHKNTSLQHKNTSLQHKNTSLDILNQIFDAYTKKQKIKIDPKYKMNKKKQFPQLFNQIIDKKLRSLIIEFMIQVISNIQSQIQINSLNLTNQLRCYPVMLLQIQVKLLRYWIQVILDLNPLKINLFKSIINKNQWQQQIPINNIKKVFIHIKKYFLQMCNNQKTIQN